MDICSSFFSLSRKQIFLKRVFDLIVSLMGLVLTWWVIIIAFILASIDTRSFGFFIQKRVGRNGRLFNVVKIKTMKSIKGIDTTVTTAKDKRITKLGAFFRKTKIDELPQLWNVLLGDMSFVGPRPDVPGFADCLKGKDRAMLSLRPGITGPATLKYRNEEAILAKQSDPERYNREVIYPDKVKINLEYMQNWSFLQDLKYILWTIF